MNEHQVYELNKIAWVFVLAHKYWTEPRFKAVLATIKDSLTVEELEAARQLWKEGK